MRARECLNQHWPEYLMEAWAGPDGRMLVPDAFQDVGGKTKWYGAALPLGLDPAILKYPDEARHFDGFASLGGALNSPRSHPDVSSRPIHLNRYLT